MLALAELQNISLLCRRGGETWGSLLYDSRLAKTRCGAGRGSLVLRRS